MRAGALTTLRRVLLPLMRPAIIAALVYSFISAMTSISAVIFLTSPRFDMATVNIVGRAEVGEYGYAAAYASVLIVVMLLAVLAIRLLVGRRWSPEIGDSPRLRKSGTVPDFQVSTTGLPVFAETTAASATTSAARPSATPIGGGTSDSSARTNASSSRRYDSA
jgi:hypothetical protein